MSSNVFTLDNLRAETKKRFEPVKIGLSDGSEVELSSLLRLPKKDRETVVAALEEVNEIDTDSEDTSDLETVVEVISKIFNAIADKPVKLLKELDDPDLMVKITLMTEVLNVWARATQLGEASNSPS